MPHRPFRETRGFLLPLSVWPLRLGVAAAMTAAAFSARADYTHAYLPRGVPGFDAEPGVTVLSRERPEYDAPGIQAGGFLVHPQLATGTGYDSRVGPADEGSWVVRTAPSVTINSDWSRDRLGGALALDSYQALGQPKQSYTDWTAALGGAKTIDDGEISLGYAHRSEHQTATSFGAVPSDTPVAYRVDEVRSDYGFTSGRVTWTPNGSVRTYSFDDTTVLGAPAPQAYRDRVVAQLGLTARYALAEQRSLLLVATGLQSRYTHPQPGQPSNNARSVLLLAGLDYLDDDMIRYQLLAGAEVRFFEAAIYGTRAAPVVEGRAIWTPTGLTTVTGQLTREIEDPAAEGTGGYTATAARLILDHEYARDILLQARFGVQVAQYIHGGGTQSTVGAGATATWLLSPNVRLALSYDLSHQGPSGNTAVETTHSASSLTAGAYTRSVGLVTVRVGL
jgi:hypothetical protein